MARDPSTIPAHAPLRVLMIAARAAPFVGGIETHVTEVAGRLVAMGHSVTVATTDATGQLPQRGSLRGFEIRRVRAWPQGRDYHWAPGLLGAAVEGDWDVIHIQGYHTFSAPLGMIAALRRKIPFVISFHSGGHSSLARNRVRRLQHAILAPLVRRASRAIGVSEFEADFFSQRMGIAREDFEVVPNGAQMTAAPSDIEPDVNRPLILSVGRLERYKGHHRVLAGFAELLNQFPLARLRLVGEGPYEGELRRLSRQLGLDQHVEIGGLPAAKRSEMADLMRQAALVTLLSEYEAHPVAVMEALSLNARVLTSDTSGFQELARKGLVRTIPVDADSAAIAEAMTSAIRSSKRKVAVDLPDWNACTEQLLAIYRSVAATSPGARAPARVRAKFAMEKSA